MKYTTININVAKKQRLLKEGHSLLDKIEANLKYVFRSIKAKKNKKAA